MIRGVGRVLMIDDDERVRGLVCEAVQTLGYEADDAEDGAPGLALLDRQRYDLVITDLRMPHMSGWEVVEAVRQRAPGMPVIIMSGFATDDDVEQAQRIVVSVLHKPFSLAELRQAIARALPSEEMLRKPLAKAPEPEVDPGQQTEGGRGSA